MKNNIALELLHSTWMMRSDNVNHYATMAHDILLGKTIDTGLFGSLALPTVPGNVALVIMNGPLIKSDVCGAEGSRTLTQQVAAAASNNAINAIIVLSESCPGGQVDGTQILADAVAAAAKIKPVYGAVSGMACSAAEWVLSGCTQVFATSGTDIIGCIGTMVKIKNPKSATEEDMIEIVSDLSPDKNAESRNPDAYKANILNPVTELFHNAVKAGRGDKLTLKKENVLSGKTYLAQAAIEAGLIDGIMPMEAIIAMAAKTTNSQSSQKKYTMSFEKTLRAASATKFAVVDGGFLLEEANLNNIEAALSANETAASLLTEATAQLAIVNGAKATAEASLATATASVTTLQAEVVALKALDGGRFTGANGAADRNEPVAVVNNYETEFDREAKALMDI